MVFLIAIWSVVVLCWLSLAIFKWKMVQLRIPMVLWGLAIVISGSVIGHDFFHIPAPIPITSDRALLGLLVATFAFLLLRQKIKLRPLVATDYLSVALLTVLFGSAVLSDWNYENNRPISRFLFFYAIPFSLYFVIKNTKISDRELKVAALGFCGFCVYLALTAVAESRGLYGLVFPSYIRNPELQEFLGRGRGPFLNPVSNGIFLTAGLATAVLLWRLDRDWRTKIVYAAIIPVLIVGNICTLTRSVWVGMAVGVGLVTWMITDRRQKAVLLIGGTVSGLLLVTVLGSSLISFKRDKHVTTNEMSQSAQLRPIFATIAWDMFLDRPFFGCGFGQYAKHRNNYLQNPHSDLQLAKGAVYLQHNVVLSLLTEVGLIGCGLFLILILKAYQEAAILLRTKKATPWAKAYAMILVATLTRYTINGMFHDVSIIPMANTLLFFLMAIVISARAMLAPQVASPRISTERQPLHRKNSAMATG